MAKTETAEYATARDQRAQAPVYLARFFHVARVGSVLDYPFSRDLASAAVNGATRDPLPILGRISGNAQTVDPEEGRSSIGTYSLELVDRDVDILRYLSNPRSSTSAAVSAGGQVDFIEAADVSGYPARGTLEIDGERMRYTSLDTAKGRFLGITRGVDRTPIEPHVSGIAVHNGEQIRAGQRVQLFAGYADIPEAGFLPVAKLEVLRVELAADGLTFTVTLSDVQRFMRRFIFVGASQQNQVQFAGHPLTLLLRVLLSTGTAKDGINTVQVTAATTVTGASTVFLTFLKPGDLVVIEPGETTEQIAEVDAIRSDGIFTSKNTLLTTTSGKQYRRVGSNGRYDMLTGAPSLGESLGTATKIDAFTLRITPLGATTAGQAIRTPDPAIRALVIALVNGDVLNLDPGGPDALTVTVAGVIDSDATTVDVAVKTSLDALGTKTVAVRKATATDSSEAMAIDGLGLPPLLVDVAGIETVRDQQFPSDIFDFKLNSQEDGKEFIERELLKPCNCYPRITQEGRYGVRRYTPPALANAVADLGEDDILEWAWAGGEPHILNQVEFAFDWNLAASPDDFQKRQRYVAKESRLKYGPRPAFQLASRGIKSAQGGQRILQDRAFHLFKRFADPPPVLSLALRYARHTLEVGDVVTVTHPRIPNRTLGRRELVRDLFEVRDLRVLFGAAGRVVVQLLHFVGDVAATPLGEDQRSALGALAVGPTSFVNDAALALSANVETETGRVTATTGRTTDIVLITARQHLVNPSVCGGPELVDGRVRLTSTTGTLVDGPVTPSAHMTAPSDAKVCIAPSVYYARRGTITQQVEHAPGVIGAVLYLMTALAGASGGTTRDRFMQAVVRSR